MVVVVVADTFAYRSPHMQNASTLRVSTSSETYTKYLTLLEGASTNIFWFPDVTIAIFLDISITNRKRKSQPQATYSIIRC